MPESGEMPTDQLSLIFAALADPTRRSILTLLADGEATVNEVAAPFPISLPAISRHLQVLERAGLITRSREAQWRHNRLRAAPLHDAVVRMQQRTRTWQARMDRLEAHLRQDAHPDARDRVEIALRVGGRYQLPMLLPHGDEFTVGYQIIELVELELLVLRSDPMPEMGMPDPS